MSWRPHGRVRVNSRSPRGAAICDRTGFAFNHEDLVWQYQWAGTRLQNLKILVGKRYLDVPQRQLGTKSLAPDPIPIWNARPEPFTFTGYSYQESNIMCQPTPLGEAPNEYPNTSGLVMAMPGGQTFMLQPANPNGSPP